jgi:hypothetical protein
VRRQVVLSVAFGILLALSGCVDTRRPSGPPISSEAETSPAQTPEPLPPHDIVADFSINGTQLLLVAVVFVDYETAGRFPVSGNLSWTGARNGSKAFAFAPDQFHDVRPGEPVLEMPVLDLAGFEEHEEYSFAADLHAFPAQGRAAAKGYLRLGEQPGLYVDQHPRDVWATMRQPEDAPGWSSNLTFHGSHCIRSLSTTGSARSSDAHESNAPCTTIRKNDWGGYEYPLISSLVAGANGEVAWYLDKASDGTSCADYEGYSNTFMPWTSGRLELRPSHSARARFGGSELLQDGALYRLVVEYSPASGGDAIYDTTYFVPLGDGLEPGAYEQEIDFVHADGYAGQTDADPWHEYDMTIRASDGVYDQPIRGTITVDLHAGYASEPVIWTWSGPLPAMSSNCQVKLDLDPGNVPKAHCMTFTISLPSGREVDGWGLNC